MYGNRLFVGLRGGREFYEATLVNGNPHGARNSWELLDRLTDTSLGGRDSENRRPTPGSAWHNTTIIGALGRNIGAYSAFIQHNRNPVSIRLFYQGPLSEGIDVTTQASSVVNCQSTHLHWLLYSAFQAVISLLSISIFGIRLSIHCFRSGVASTGNRLSVWWKSRGFLGKPATQNGTFNIGAGSNPTRGAYNKDVLIFSKNTPQ